MGNGFGSRNVVIRCRRIVQRNLHFEELEALAHVRGPRCLGVLESARQPPDKLCTDREVRARTGEHAGGDRRRQSAQCLSSRTGNNCVELLVAAPLQDHLEAPAP